MEQAGAKKNTNSENQQWENPVNPEAPTDARDEEQKKRQHEETQRINKALTESGDDDKQSK